MVNTRIVYQGDLRCELTHGPSGVSIITDAPVDNHGKGESFSPTDLCATALGACMMTIMGIQANSLGISIEGATVDSTKEMSVDLPRRIVKIGVRITLPAGVPEDARKRLENAGRACPVFHSLHPDIEKAVEFIWQ